MKFELISYQDNGTQLEAYSAYETAEKRPLVLLCHAWKGRDDFITEKANQIAALGFVGFAIDMYGKGVLGKNNQENAALKKPFLDDRQLLQKRLLKGYHTACSLANVDASRVIALGFGFGGLCALDLARSGVALEGVVSIYGHFDAPKNCPNEPIKSKVLVLHGYNDPVSTLAELDTFQKELDERKVDWQSHIFANSFHAFANPSANDPSAGILYNPLSAERAWRDAKNFIVETFL